MPKHVQLTKIKIQRFKRLDEAEFEIGPVTVLCGPNNFGKTTALQALTLWYAGLQQWLAKRSVSSTADKRPGVAINRLELTSLPVSSTRQLWLREEVRRTVKGGGSENVRINVIVDGITDGEAWTCGLEFDYPNDESIYCRPMRLDDGRQPKRMPVPEGAAAVRVALLPPMSGLAATEPKWLEGRIDALIGEGRTAEVLRNLCHRLYAEDKVAWAHLTQLMSDTFHVDILPPKLIEARGELAMEYVDRISGCRLDLSASGRGQQQLLLLLAYLLSNRGTVLLLDEPDAHLEILRQRQTYNLLAQVAMRQGAQILAASHSEVVLAEAAQKDTVIAFLGKKPRPLVSGHAQLGKWLKHFPVDHLYQAELTGSILYLEGATDLAILQEFASNLGHKAQLVLGRPFVNYVGTNQPGIVRDHFYALREAYPDIRGVALFDRVHVDGTRGEEPLILSWQRREIENYFFSRDVLLRWAKADLAKDLIGLAESRARTEAMEKAIEIEEQYADGLGTNIWGDDAKASEVIDKIMRRFHKELGNYNEMGKANFHTLVKHLEPSEYDKEISEKLDALFEKLQNDTLGVSPTVR